MIRTNHLHIISLLFQLIILFFTTVNAEQLQIPVGAIFGYGKQQEMLKNAFFLAIKKHSSPLFKVNVSYSLTNLNNTYDVQKTICKGMLPYGAFAIFGDTNQNTLDSIQDLVSIFHVPYITAGLVKEERPVRKDYILNLRPRHTEAIVQALEMYNWTQFAYLVNTQEGLNRFTETLKVYHARKDYVDLNIQLRFISNPNYAYNDLGYLDTMMRQRKKKHIVIDLDPPEVMTEFLRQIREMGMNRREYHYLATGIGAEQISTDGLERSGVNLTGFQLLNFTDPEVNFLKKKWGELCIDKKWECTGSRSFPLYEVALLMDGVEVFIQTLETLLKKTQTRRQIEDILRTNKHKMSCYSKDQEMEHAIKGRNIYAYHYDHLGIQSSLPVQTSVIGEIIMNQMVLNVTTGFTGQIYFDNNGFRSNYSLKVMELSGQDEDGKRNLTEVATWRENGGMNWFPSTGSTNRDQNENDTQIMRVVTIATKPFLDTVVAKPGEKVPVGNDRYEGFCVDMFDHIAKKLNIQYEIHLVGDNNYGAKLDKNDPNSKWNGMIGELMDNKADIAVAPLTINPERAQVVDFTEPFLTFGISVMIRKPGKKEKPGIFSFLSPLHRNVWICILAGCLGVSVGLYIISKISPAEWQIEIQEDQTQKIERDFTFQNALWFSFAAFVNQGVDIAPKSAGARVLSSVWWFFTLIMIAYYTATLAAFLTIELLVTPINDWKDLVTGDKGIKYGTLNSGSTRAFFQTTRLPPFNQMGEYIEKNAKDVNVNTTEEGVQRVIDSKEKYCFILESKMNEYYNNRDPCLTMLVGQPFGDKGYGIATPIGSQLREQLNQAVLQLREEQTIQALYKKWWIEKGQCQSGDSGGGSLNALSLINVAGVFYILVSGLGISLFTALLEFYYIAKSGSKKAKQTFAKNQACKARLTVLGDSDNECRHTTLPGTSTQSSFNSFSNTLNSSFKRHEEFSSTKHFPVPVHVHQQHHATVVTTGNERAFPKSVNLI